jgi:hypothetical protein
MENHSESTNENTVSAWSYRHDWSSDSCSSDEDSSRSSSAEPAHSLHPLEKTSNALTTSESGVLQDGICRTASSNEAVRAESGTFVLQNIINDQSKPAESATGRQSKLANTLKLEFAMSPSPSFQSAVSSNEGMQKDNGRVQTPVVQVNDTSVAESLHSPRPQRYFRPSVTCSEEPVQSLPLYDDIRTYAGPGSFPTSQYNYSMNMEGHPRYDYPEAQNPSLQDHPLDTLYRLPGFELISKALAQKASELDPIYRGFEEMRHRIALHLQHEISQLEEALHKLDREIQSVSTNDTATSTPPSLSISPDGHFRGHVHQDVLLMKHQRTLLLGRIFEKLQQYGKYLISNMRCEKVLMEIDRALLSFSSHRTKFNSPSTKDLSTYKTLLSDIDTLTPLERRFLDHTEDLIVARHHHNQPQDISNGSWLLNSKAVTLLLLFIVPLSMKELHWVFVLAGVSILIIVNR